MKHYSEIIPTAIFREPDLVVEEKARIAIKQYKENHWPISLRNPYSGYETLLRDTLLQGFPKQNRTGVHTWGVHSAQRKFDLSKGLPVTTTKKLHLKSVIYELLWFIKGDTNIKYLNDNGVTIWDEWADMNGDLGPVYGKQWVAWEGVKGVINQLEQLMQKLENDPLNRRKIVSAWNVEQIPQMALSPCHVLWQVHVRTMSLMERRHFYAEKNGVAYKKVAKMTDDVLDSLEAPIFELSLQLYQRSADIFLGVPFNIVSYAILTEMLAQVANMKPGWFIHGFGDLHIYENHFDQVVEQLKREPRPYPKLILNPNVKSIYDFRYDDFTIEGYNPHPRIKAAVAV